MTTNPFYGNWTFPTNIRFGAGRITEIDGACQAIACKNPLLVTDNNLVNKEIFARLKSIVSKNLTFKVYSNVDSNPKGDNVTLGVQSFHQGQHDGIIAFGGGSALDVAKAIALMVGQTRPLWDFEDREDWYTRVKTEKMSKVIAIPTTAGTGSEVGRASVIIEPQSQQKKIIFHPLMMPSIVILDPELTLTLPINISMAVGMDALSHCLEAYCSPVFHPLAEGIAVEGIRLIKNELPKIIQNPDNINARAQLLISASMGATAFQKGLGAMHALSHPCSSILGTHHGLTNAVLMPYVLQANKTAISDKIIRLAKFLELSEPTFSGFLQWILDFRKQLAIPHSLEEIGVTLAYVEQIAALALIDPSLTANPKLMHINDLKGVLVAAIKGDL